MNAQTIGWFVFLAIFKNFSCATKLFKLDDNTLEATEGSCIEIKCTATSEVNVGGAYWFWMKNAEWDEKKKDFVATIIYSTNSSIRPVSQDYASRVTYTGSPPSNWDLKTQNSVEKFCSILICNLNETDSGNYSFRFVGTSDQKWRTNVVNLTVTENPCPITFERPPVVKASDRITLTCSTLSSCPTSPQIQGLTQLHETSSSGDENKTKNTTVSFKTSWENDGNVFSCKASEDVYLIQNINITVEYAPQVVLAKKSLTDIIEGEHVTLTCSAKGRPDPEFTWFKPDNETHTGPELMLQSISPSDSGTYRCEAKNKHGTVQSEPVLIDVTYKPEVEIIMTPTASEVKQGDEITLTCHVKRSNPQPSTVAWFRNESIIDERTFQFKKEIEPDDGGSYKCTATNRVGTGTSQLLGFTVLYRPVKPTISINRPVTDVKVDQLLTFVCNTSANPKPTTYSWYRYYKHKQTDSTQWTSMSTNDDKLSLNYVQRGDEACYMCNATNSIATGRDSDPLCIEVCYPPSTPMLSMDTEVKEGQRITISCTVDSHPPSDLTLKSSSTPNSQGQTFFSCLNKNTLQHSFNVTSTHAGYYTCIAKNKEGLQQSTQRKLVVRYRPTDMKIEAKNGLTVVENALLKLHCTATSHPNVISYTWMKMANGKPKIIEKKQTLEKPATPFDGGLYICEARNEMGTGNKQVEVVVKYAPKNTTVTAAEEQQLGEKSSVKLTCSSHSNPEVQPKDYTWYRKSNDKGRDKQLTSDQSYTVYSDKPGVYYCIAKNEINQNQSNEVELFVERGYVKVLKIFFLFLIILIVICLIFFVLRRKRSKLIRQRTTNTSPCFGFLGGWNYARRRGLMNEPVMAEPFRSRDDLLPDQTRRPNAHGRQPVPDSTPESNITSVYCTVNLPAGKRGPAAQKPIRQQGGCTEDESLNYASIHFENKQKPKQTRAEENAVYAMVSKQKPPKKNEPHGPDDYENIIAAHAAKSPNPLGDDTDTSEDEDEVELNYAQVSFKAKSGHQKGRKDSSSSTSSCTSSSTSDEEGTQYSQVKT